MCSAKVNTGNFIAIHREEEQSWVEAFALPVTFPSFQTFLEGFFHMTEVITKSFCFCTVHGFNICSRVIKADSNAFRELRLGHRRIQFDEHVVQAANATIAKILEQLLRLFGLSVCVQAWRKT